MTGRGDSRAEGPPRSKAAVIGSPVSRSRSPEIFGFLARSLGVPALSYEAREVTAAELPAFVAELRADPGWVGVNVTIPHKEAIVPLLDELHETARMAGAVNVVRRSLEGRLVGHNSDIEGVERALSRARVTLAGRWAWVFGAGGAARAVACACARAGAAGVLVHAPGSPRTERLIADLSPLFPGTRFEAAGAAPAGRAFGLVANATPLGGFSAEPRAGEPGLFAALGSLRRDADAAAFDVVYQPRRTAFLKAAEREGYRSVEGLDMLVDQAISTFVVWFGEVWFREIRSGREALAQRLLTHLSRRDHRVYLTGFMGAGKSTVGRLLAERLGWRFVDTDRVVEERAGEPVAAVFAKRGEAAFRALEKETVAEASIEPVSATRGCVVALGGGAVLDPDSWAAIEGSGTVVFLEAPAATLAARVGDPASRPLLAGAGGMERFEFLLNERMPLYRRAHLVLPTEGRTPEDVVAELVAKLGLGLPADEEEGRR